MKHLFRIPEILFGADYNPEQWPIETWKEDIVLMQRAQVNCVSLAIFSWGRLEPADGKFEFEWLDTIMDMLHKGGITVNLATATASPPAWLCKKHSDVLPVDAQGRTLWPGSRQHYNPASTQYARYAARLLERVAQRYSSHPSLISWHINNEYGCHVHESFDDESAQHFRTWLEKRYGTIEALNLDWNTGFWSQHYGDFDEVLPPRMAPHNPNPSQVLDWRRFWADAYTNLVEMERGIIRAYSPNVPISTNLVGGQFHLDRRSLCKNLDYTSWNSYPDPSLGTDELIMNALFHDMVRSLKRDRPFVLMEQVNTQVCWRPINTQKGPGSMRAHSFQALARGADGIMYFQWRQSKAGDEMFHGAMVPHAGADGPDGTETRAFRDIRQLGEELVTLKTIVGSIQKPKVALLFNADSNWALSLPSKPAAIDTIHELQKWYGALWNHHVDVDIVHPGEDFSSYRLLIAPSLHLVTQTEATNLTHFVQEGGILVATYFSAIVDEKNHAYLGGHPKPLQDILGLWVEEWHPLERHQKTAISSQEIGSGTASNWQELVNVSSAQVVAHYADGTLAGRPAVTRNSYGKGKAFYVSADVDQNWQSVFVRAVLNESGIPVEIGSDPGVETSTRTNGEQDFLFVINHNYEAAIVDLGIRYGTDLLTGKTCAGQIRLQSQEVLVLSSTHPASND